MDFSKITDFCSIIFNSCLTAWMEEWNSCLWVIYWLNTHTNTVKELLNHTLHCEEISLTEESQCEHNLLFRKLFSIFIWQINLCHLIELNILITSVIVSCKRCKHSVKRQCPHYREVFTKRIRYYNCLSI